MLHVSIKLVVSINTKLFCLSTCWKFALFVGKSIEMLVIFSLTPMKSSLSLSKSYLSSMSVNLRIAIVLLRFCLRLAIFFLDNASYFSIAYMTKSWQGL